ncbi:hypothetical protein A1O7_09797 [Cladophialophora yegresii CBS 114405]|uniref:Uncharacterized protein n=1 Tax=Cladophialophora yegresii CBS 114405 TaxID=1182544 RepID=W9VFQ4_9EURO|nr:uncharacterized protein A1O7_09797 [Cladophialophora yegresii CBS 114405]EXJ54457.1 hypothetical protein A1O7_09797 [Cladophialophora yegresii CBS 114405]
MSHQESFFDFETDILNRTPPLVPVKPDLEPHDSPAPFVRIDTSSDSTDVEQTDGVPSSRKKRRKKRKGRTNPTFADGVLIRSLDPNHLELASHVERNALASASQSEVEEEDNKDGRRLQMSRPSEVVQSRATQDATRRREIAVSNNADKDDDWAMIDTPVNTAEARYPPPSPISGGDACPPRHQEQNQASTSPLPEDPPKKHFDTRPPPLNERLGLKLKPGHGPAEEDEDSIIKSPALAKFYPPCIAEQIAAPVVAGRSVRSEAQSSKYQDGHR